MRNLFSLIVLFVVVASGSLFGQSKSSIVGRVLDDAGEPLAGASVMLLQAKDSILQSFALSAADGKFRFDAVPAGDYVFKSILLKHNTLVLAVTVDGKSPEVVLDNVKMVPLSSDIEAVEIVDERQPIRLKGDTIEYDAKAFKTQGSDNVEALLKKLPGVEVDNDGNIKAQGQSVTKILVDGKEFFGDDPKVASKNLPAGAINKVQVFDKRSEISDFTGIDDGTRDRTINLTLKEEYKKGYFGNVMAGYGTKNRFEGKASLNRYADKSQLSFIGQANNTNQQGFSFQDYTNFIGGMQNMVRGDGNGGGGGGNGGPGGMGGQGGTTQVGLNLSSNPNSGFFTTAAGGLNGNWDVTKKTRLTASYFYNGLQKDLDRTATKETILENGSYTTDEDGTQQDRNSNHRLNFNVRHDIDTLTRITLRNVASTNATTSDITNLTNSSLLGGNSNVSDQLSNSIGSVQDLSSNLNLMHRYRKKGRSFALNGNFRYNPQDKNIDVRSINAFSSSSFPAFIDTIRQNQQQQQGFVSFGGNFSHSEPTGSNHVVDASVNFQQTQNQLEKNFFDISSAGENLGLNSLLSSAYSSIYRYGRAGLNWRFFTKRTNLNLGLAAQKSELQGEIITTSTPIRKEFFNVLPSLEWRFNIAKSQRFSMNYNTRMNEPSLTQLQPVPDNSNPLNITIGNPNLGAEYAHRLRLNYTYFDQFSFTSFFASMNGSYTKNKISSMTTVDSLLRQVTQSVNVDHDININSSVNFSTPIRKLHMKIGVNGNSTVSRSIVFINGVQNFVNRYTQGGDIRLENKTKDHFDASVGGRTSYTVSKYPTASNYDQSYINSGLFGEITVFLPKKFVLMTGIDCSIYAGAGFNSNQVVPLWRAYASKKIFGNGRGEIKISAYDLLNRNIGISRSAQLNYQQQEQVTTLSRYFLASFSYQIVAISKK